MPRRIILATWVFVGATTMTILPGGGTAHADNGLAVTNTTTYVIDADAGVVHVSAEMTFTNQVPDERKGNVIQQAYFSGFSLPVPVGSVNAVATTSRGTGLRLDGRLVPGNVDYFVYDIRFASSLFFGDTTRITVTYDLTGFAPRSLNPSRVNLAYAAFSAFGIGDDGKVTVRIVAPKGSVVDTFGNEVERTEEGDSVVYTATNIPNPEEFDLFVSARYDRALTEQDIVTDAGNSFRLRSWPNDPEWADFTADLLDRGVEELSTLIGVPWPITEELEVREAYTPYLYGYAGWFSAIDLEVEIGEDLDQNVVLHELSHAWFNTNWFVDRWLSEGFAQTYSALAAVELGGANESPAEVRSTDPGRVTLNEWGDPDFVGGADDVETYGYNAAWSVIDTIVDEIGIDKMSLVLAAADERTLAYLGDGPAEPAGFSVGWRHFLDLVDELGGSTEAEALISQYVVTDKEQLELDARTVARAAYHTLEEDGGEWAPPLGVRRQMAKWKFDDADELIAAASKIIVERDKLTATSATLGVDLPPTLESDYESATERLDGVRDEVAEQLDAANTLLAAVNRESAEQGLFDRVGLIGTNLPGLLDEGRAALAAGDTELARSKAAEVNEVLRRAPDVGKQRGLLALGGFVLLDGIGLMLVFRSRRRRRRRRTEAAEQASILADLAAEPDLAVVPADDLTVLVHDAATVDPTIELTPPTDSDGDAD